VLNAAPAQPLPPQLLAAVDLLVVNEVEAIAITGKNRTHPEALLDVVPRAVLTLRAAGAWYGDRDGTAELIPPPMVEAVDSTAAGDAFTAALAVAWGEGRPILDAVRWACAAGAACVRKLGAFHALPTRDEISELYASAYGTGAGVG
jgi:ribokinase